MKLIGLAGVAKVGKDTFLNGLRDAYPEYSFGRVSVGDIIRSNLSGFIMSELGINIWGCSPEEKEFVRPLLAWYGDVKRKQTQGMFFLNQLERKIKNLVDTTNPDFVVLTDVRFKEFAIDEPDWIHQRGGILIHIQRVLPDGTIAQPANALESLNDPKLRKCADVKIGWPTLLPTEKFREKIAGIIRTLEPLSQKPIQTYHTAE